MNLNQSGLNADVVFNGGSGQNQLTLVGADAADDFRINNNNIEFTGNHTIATNGMQQVTVQGGSIANTFEVLGTLANSETILQNGFGSNTSWIGSDGKNDNGSLDRIRGQVTISGAAGSADQLNVDDRAAQGSNSQPLTAGYVITPSQIIDDLGSQFATRILAGILGSSEYFAEVTSP